MKNFLIDLFSTRVTSDLRLPNSLTSTSLTVPSVPQVPLQMYVNEKVWLHLEASDTNANEIVIFQCRVRTR